MHLIMYVQSAVCISVHLVHDCVFLGRCMFETTSVPQGWVRMINDYLDEVWVPSKFQKAVFLKEGVKKRIVVIKVTLLTLITVEIVMY